MARVDETRVELTLTVVTNASLANRLKEKIGGLLLVLAKVSEVTGPGDQQKAHVQRLDRAVARGVKGAKEVREAYSGRGPLTVELQIQAGAGRKDEQLDNLTVELKEDGNAEYLELGSYGWMQEFIEHSKERDGRELILSLYGEEAGQKIIEAIKGNGGDPSTAYISDFKMGSSTGMVEQFSMRLVPVPLGEHIDGVEKVPFDGDKSITENTDPSKFVQVVTCECGWTDTVTKPKTLPRVEIDCPECGKTIQLEDHDVAALSRK